MKVIPKYFAQTFNDRWFDRMREEVADLKAQSVADSDNRVLSRCLEMYAAGYSAQRVGYRNLLHTLEGGGLGASFHMQDSGIVFQGMSFGMDWLNVIGPIYSGRPATTPQYLDFYIKLAGAGSFFESALEHGLIDQLQRTKGGVSTIRALTYGNLPNNGIYYVTDANWSDVRAQLIVNGFWPTAALAKLDATFPSGGEAKALVHRKYNVSSGEPGDTWNGVGYWILPPGAASGVFVLGDINGGQSNQEGDWNPITALLKTLAAFGEFALGTVEGVLGFNPKSVEPVDLATGSYLSDHTDLVIGGGEAPRGISFSRSYNSLKSQEAHELGYGWSHNWDVRLRPASYFPIQFGGRLPVDTVAQIVACHIALDLAGQGQDDVRELMGLVFTAAWSADQQVENVAALNTGHRVDLFTRQPDGSFTAPPGSTGTLTKTGSNYAFAQRHGSVYQFGDVSGEQRLAKVTDQHGKELNVAYDSGKVSTVTDCWDRSITFHYTGARLTSASDSADRSVGFGHSVAGDLETYTDADANTFTFVYDSHRITDWIDEQSRPIAKNFYSPLGKVEQQWSEGDDEHEWTFFWSGYENVERDPLNNQKRYFFDGTGRHVAFTDPEGRRSSLTLDAEDQAVRVTDALGRYVVNQYNADLNRTLTTVYAADDVVIRSESFQYDSAKRLWKSTNGRNLTTEFLYNARHQLEKTIDPDLKFTEVNYNTDGTKNWSKDRTGATTNFTNYDKDNPRNVTSPLSKTIQYEYTALGDVFTVRDAKLNLTQFKYNGRRMAREITDATNRVATTHYDGHGNPDSETDRLGRASSATYNALGKIRTKTDALLKTATTEYDARDLVWKTISPGSRTTTMLRGDSGWLERIEMEIGFTETDVDDSGRPQFNRNALNQETSTVFDDVARTRTVTNPRNEPVVQKVDQNGNLTHVTNGRGFTTVLEYDSIDRLETTTTPEQRLTSVAYVDGTLQRTETVTESSLQQTTRHFNAGGQLDWITDALGTINYAYDDNGKLDTITEGSATATYGRADPLDRVTSYTDENGKVIGYGYDLTGAPSGEYRSSITYPGTPGPVYYDRDKLDRLKRITDWANRPTTFTYYDNAANGEDGELNEIIRPNNTRRKHFYDEAGRLERVDELDASGYLIARFDLTLDDVGKVEREFRVPRTEPWAVDSWTATYDDDDWFLSHSGGAIDHDDDGNLTDAPGKVGGTVAQQSFSFNARNQLTAVPSSSAVYAYNAEGHLKSRTLSGTTTTYLVDPVGSLSKVLAATTGGETTRYVYGLGLLYEEKSDGTIRSYHFDCSGNTVALCGADGLTITGRAQHSPYGNLAHVSGAVDTPFQYNGRYGVLTDPATGLIHMRARWYSPYLKRFINRDPAGFAGGMNFFAFASGNPITFADPSGLGPQAWGRTLGNAIAGPIIGTVNAFTEVGYFVFPRGASGNLASYSYFGVLGILTGEDGAQAAANNDRVPYFVNESHGAIADIVQSGWQKAFNLFGYGDSLTISMGQQLNQAGIYSDVTIYGHSQGSLVAAGLFRYGFISGSGSSLVVEGPAISSLSAFAIGFLYEMDVTYNQKFGDVIGFANFPNILNPLTHPAAIIDVFALGGIHTSY